MSNNNTPKNDNKNISGTPQTNNLIHSLNDLQLTLQATQGQSSMSKPSRDLSLQQELDQLVKINDTISNISESLEVTDMSLNRMINHTEQSNELLNLWIKILSQNHHTYNLLKDKENWKGSSEFEQNHELKLQHLAQLDLRLQSLKQQKKTEDELKRHREEERQKLAAKKDRRIYKTRV